jgi:hypothetical protein
VWRRRTRETRRRILALLQAHPEGRTIAEIQTSLAIPRSLTDPVVSMARQGLLRRLARGVYGIA